MNIRATSTFRAGDFARTESLIVPRIKAGVAGACGAVLEEASSLAPRSESPSSGTLATSGKAQQQWIGTRVDGSVAFLAPYSAFVEFGTGIRGQGTYPYALPVEGVPYTGGWVYDFRRQNWQGHGAQPYLRPALDTRHDDILGAFRAQGFQI